MIEDKIKSRDELILLCDEFRKKKRIIGFTSGTFDFLHAGHVDYLEKVKMQCDILIVGVNSDESVKKYKGLNRPIIPERSRAKIIAALEVVDYVFIFEERRNQQNITLLKPNYYFKAGDYKIDQLTSRSTIEAFGGKVILIPLHEAVSTTGIIEKILSTHGSDERYVEDEIGVGHFERKPSKMQPAIFLDRDGTINKDVGYISEPEKFEFLPNALEGMKMLHDMGYRLIIVTNQGGIGLGYFTKEDFYQVNKKMLHGVSQFGILIDKIYFCPHSLAETCDCRKPAIGLLQRAQNEMTVDLAHSYFIGDSSVDIETGKNFGIHTILIQNDPEKNMSALKVKPDFIATDLLHAANIILEEDRK